jgi:predicted metal-dependent enzyme (double-stranded beta helix superfamily)
VHLDDFIYDLRRARRDHDLKTVQDLVVDAIHDRPLAAELGDPGTSQVLHAESGLLVLHAVAAPTYCTAPHNHRTWSVVGVYDGREDNVFYQRIPAGQRLERTGGRQLDKGEVLVLDDAAIHHIANSRQERLTALHVYGANIFALDRSAWSSDGTTEEAFVFDRHAGGSKVM